MRASGAKAVLSTRGSIAGALVAASAVVVVSAAPAHAAPPANDAFAARQVLPSLGTYTGTNVEATREAGEQEHLGHSDGASVWYAWTAPGDGSVSALDVDLAGSTFDTTLTVYTGATDLATMSFVRSNDDNPAGGLQSKLAFSATADQTYFIVVDGYPGPTPETGSIQMELTATTITPTGAITGTVIDSAAAFVEDVCVDALDDSGTVLNAASAMTDSSGAYQLIDVPAGDLHVRFRNCNDTANVAGEYYNDAQTLGAAADVEVVDGVTTTGINAELADGGTITGTITSPDAGADLQDVCVTATMVGGDDAGFTRRTRTGPTGGYTLTGLDGGDYRIEFGEIGACPNNSFVAEFYDDVELAASAQLVDVAEGGLVTDIDADLETGTGWLQGTVKDWLTGEDVEDICVAASSDDANYDSAVVETDPGGQYLITDLPSALDYIVTFSDCNVPEVAGYATQYYNTQLHRDAASEVTVAAGHGTGLIDARMYVAGSLSGTVADIENEPIEDICVTAYTDADVEFDDTVTDVDGTWSMPAAPGNYKLEFFDCSGDFATRWYEDETTQANADLVTVNPGQDVDGLDQVLPDADTGTITGTVTDGTNPVEGICVDASSDSAGSYEFDETDANGEYQLRFLDPATDWVVVFGPCDPLGPNLLRQLYDDVEFATVDDYENATPVTVTAGTVTTGIDAGLHAGGQIAGTITDTSPSHAPIPGVCVAAIDALGVIQGVGRSNASGQYSIRALYTGNYTVNFGIDLNPMMTCSSAGAEEWYDNTNAINAIQVHVDAGSTTPGIDADLVRSGSISGRVTNEAGDPVEATVYVTSLDGLTDLGEADTDEDGYYTIGELDTDSYLVEFSSCSCTFYGDEFYDNRLSPATADHVDVVFGADTGGIDAVLQDALPVNTALPKALGTPRVGATLTTDNGVWDHEPSVYEYEWFQCGSGGGSCTTIPGADESTYVPVADDSGHRIRVEVTATNSIGTAPTVRSWATGIIGKPGNTVLPVITGSTVTGSTLTATTGTWTGSPFDYDFQWLRCDSTGGGCAPIGLATTSTYDTTVDDAGSRIRVEVTATNSVDSSSVRSAATLPIGAPTNTVLPTITGGTTVGATLTAGNGSWSGSPTGYAYQWLRCNAAGSACSPIDLATGSTYAATGDDVGSRIRVDVTASNTSGGGTARSWATGLIGKPGNTALPVITGSTATGSTLTSSTGTWTGSSITYGYQWLRCDAAGGSCAPIDLATANTYVTTVDDVGGRIKVDVTATNSNGSTTARSAASALIGAPTNTALPVASGGTATGATQSVSTGTWTGTSITYSYQWLRCDSTGSGCAPIDLATGTSYVTTGDDVGHRLRVDVTATNSTGSLTVRTWATGIIGRPGNTALPAITGSTVATGATLTASTGTWTGTSITYSYQWLRCDGAGTSCAPISLATADTYVTTVDDVGSRLKVDVTATNAADSTTARSAATGVIGAPSNTALPAITGSTVRGATLSASTGTWTGSPTSYAYQWLRCDSAGAACVAIDVNNTYVTVVADVGHRIRVDVTAVNAAGATTVRSWATGVITSS